MRTCIDAAVIVILRGFVARAAHPPTSMNYCTIVDIVKEEFMIMTTNGNLEVSGRGREPTCQALSRASRRRSAASMRTSAAPRWRRGLCHMIAIGMDVKMMNWMTLDASRRKRPSKRRMWASTAGDRIHMLARDISEVIKRTSGLGISVIEVTTAGNIKIITCAITSIEAVMTSLVRRAAAMDGGVTRKIVQQPTEGSDGGTGSITMITITIIAITDVPEGIHLEIRCSTIGASCSSVCAGDITSTPIINEIAAVAAMRMFMRDSNDGTMRRGGMKSTPSAETARWRKDKGIVRT
jgi:hypothetical protein